MGSKPPPPQIDPSLQNDPAWYCRYGMQANWSDLPGAAGAHPECWPYWYGYDHPGYVEDREDPSGFGTPDYSHGGPLPGDAAYRPVIEADAYEMEDLPPPRRQSPPQQAYQYSAPQPAQTAEYRMPPQEEKPGDAKVLIFILLGLLILAWFYRDEIASWFGGGRRRGSQANSDSPPPVFDS